jgi:hypothetical protein
LKKKQKTNSGHDGRIIFATSSKPKPKLLKQIAARVNVSLTNLGLILIGYADALGPSIPVANEVLDIFGEDALIEFFARAFREKSLVPDQDKVVDKVAAVLKDLDPNQPDYVEQVCTRAIAELETL